MRNCSRKCKAAFSLVELLVTLGVIAVLIAVLAPALSRARDAAKDTACLNNHCEFGIAFATYFADFDLFPSSDYPSYGDVWRNWAGVHWYLDDADLPNYLVDPNRPMNKYFGVGRDRRARMDVFRCPRDNGMRHYRTDEIVEWHTEFGMQTIDSDGPNSVYSVYGNSYCANDWMYCTPGSDVGIGPYPDIPFFRTDLGPDDVEPVPSRFVLVCDHGPNWAGRYPLHKRIAWNIVYGWWHGYEVGQMTFLDGSARQEKMPGEVTTQTYTFYMAPDRHGPNSYRRFDRP